MTTITKKIIMITGNEDFLRSVEILEGNVENYGFWDRVAFLACKFSPNLLRCAKRFKKYGVKGGYKAIFKYDLYQKDIITDCELISTVFDLADITEAIKVADKL